MTINILHLLWITPLMFSGGFIVGGILTIGKRDDEVRADLIRDIRNAQNWKGGWGA